MPDSEEKNPPNWTALTNQGKALKVKAAEVTVETPAASFVSSFGISNGTA
jgi:hypothetical protein